MRFLAFFVAALASASGFCLAQTNPRSLLGASSTAANSIVRSASTGWSSPISGQKRMRVRIKRGAAPIVPSSLHSTTHRLSVGADASNLTFTFAGYASQTQRDTLSTFLRLNYERIVEVWGPPAPSQRGKNIVIRGDGNEGDAIYFPPATDSPTNGGEIFFNYRENFSAQTNTYNLTRVVLNAFWGAHIPSYQFLEGRYIEPWVLGMSDACAAQIAFLAAGSPADFNPSALYDDLLPVYDFFNRPELGSAFVFSPNGTDVVIADFRLSMAQATFLKMAIEKPTFFADFNRALYAQTTPRAPLAMSNLKSIAAGVLPTVEGQNFSAWVRQQYVLDGSVTTGQKLYAGVLPLPVNTTGDTRAAVQAFVQAFSTDANGNETPSTGFGSVSATDFTGLDLTPFSSELGASNVVEFNDTRSYPGQGYNVTDAQGRRILGLGFTPINSGQPALITLKFRFRDAEALAYFPYNATGSQASPLTYYGAAPGVTNVSMRLNDSEDVPVSNGAFRANSVYPGGPRVQTQFVLNGRTLRRNTAWLAPGAGVNSSTRGVGFLLEVPPLESEFTFSAPPGASGVRMVSFPFTPILSDEAAMLQLPANSLAMARFRPNLSPAARQGEALVFGIGSDRHELYPNISTPVAPGRGYWLGTGTGGLTRTIRGSEPPRDVAFEVPLLGGWNQVGPPFNRAFAPGSVKVRYAGFAPVALSVAQSRGWVAPGIWRWLPDGGYSRVDVENGGNLEPFVGYYIFAAAPRGTSLVFEPQNSATSALQSRTGWSVPLQVLGARGRDISTRFGVSGDQNVAKPPTGAEILTLSLSEASAGATGNANAAAQSGSGLAESFATSLGNGISWRATIHGAQSGERISLSWGDLRDIPTGVILQLRDEKSGETKILLPGGIHRFIADGTPRHFTLSAAPLSNSAASALSKKAS